MILFRKRQRRILPPPENRNRKVPYALPTTTSESDRLDFQHFMLRYALRGNYLAPLNHPLDILDVGTGTGRWAIEMAQKFPEANVISIDTETMHNMALIRALSLRNERAPDNFAFLEGNILTGLEFQNQSFDFTHQRLLTAAIPAVAWRGVVNDLIRVTRKNGWVELVEGAGAVDGGPAISQISEWGITACAFRGIDINMSAQVGRMLSDAGLNHVYFTRLDIPIGWGGRIGQMMTQDYFAAVAAMRAAVVPRITDNDTFTRTLAAAKEEVTKYRATCPFFIAYGQRP